jgi:excinuclease UvrABC helicase subunit UvrB
VFNIRIGQEYVMEDLLNQLVNIQYKRAAADFKPGNFQVM